MAPAVEDAEVHRQHSSDVERFIALLVGAASGQKSRCTIVLTVRADFYARLIRQTLLSTLLPRQQVNIPPMTSSDLRSAIEMPARKAGLAFAPPALVDQILDDVGTEEGRLDFVADPALWAFGTRTHPWQKEADSAQAACGKTIGFGRAELRLRLAQVVLAGWFLPWVQRPPGDPAGLLRQWTPTRTDRRRPACCSPPWPPKSPWPSPSRFNRPTRHRPCTGFFQMPGEYSAALPFDVARKSDIHRQ
jgi:hypothetical protein